MPLLVSSHRLSERNTRDYPDHTRAVLLLLYLQYKNNNNIKQLCLSVRQEWNKKSSHIDESEWTTFTN